MKIVSREKWNDGTLVEWEVKVREIQLSQSVLEAYEVINWETFADAIKLGLIVRAFIVEEILTLPDQERSEDEDEPIAGNEFWGVHVGDELVLGMNLGEYAAKVERGPADLYSSWPQLVNIQDVSFDVEVVEEN